MLGGGGTSRVRANTHRDGTVRTGREHGAPEMSWSNRLSNVNLPDVQALDSELSKNVDQKVGLTGAEGIRGDRQALPRANGHRHLSRKTSAARVVRLLQISEYKVRPRGRRSFRSGKREAKRVKRQQRGQPKRRHADYLLRASRVDNPRPYGREWFACVRGHVDRRHSGLCQQKPEEIRMGLSAVRSEIEIDDRAESRAGGRRFEAGLEKHARR